MDPEQYRDMDRRTLWHPYTRHSRLQEDAFPVITGGEGPYLIDADGRRFLDGISSWWCVNLGHGHPRLVDALVRQARRLQHSILGNMSHPPAIELAQKLKGLFEEPRHSLFAADGASAVEAALKIALQYRHNIGQPERTRFVSLEGAYHGDTLGAVSVGYQEAFHRPFKSILLPGLQAKAPRCGAFSRGITPHDCGLDCFVPMREILEQHAREITAVIVEPLCQGAAGMRIYSPRYLAVLAELCRAKDILLIVDEIAMGFGRTGSMFAFEQAGISPDIVCLGKGLSGGYLPISATVVTDRIYDTFCDRPDDHTFYHGHTFAGNPIAAAVALEALRVYEDEAIVEKVARLGVALRDELSALRGLPHVADVRCLGMIGAVELADSDGTSGAELAARVCRKLLTRGILLRPLGSVVYLMLPLIVTEELVRQTARAVCEEIEAAM